MPRPKMCTAFFLYTHKHPANMSYVRHWSMPIVVLISNQLPLADCSISLLQNVNHLVQHFNFLLLSAVLMDLLSAVRTNLFNLETVLI